MDKLFRSILLARATSAIAERVGDTVRRVATITLCVALAAIFALTAAGCVVAALWIYLRPQIGPVLAPLAVALLFLVLAVALLLASRLIGRGKKAVPAKLAAPTVAGPDPLAALSNDALRLFSEHKGAALLAALLAGAFAARKR